jgi:tetratricopeptide (TPR) repeat protein
LRHTLILALILAATPALADLPPEAMGAADALRAGRAADAEELATKALTAKDLAAIDHAHILLNRALAREQLGRRRDALTDFNDAIALDGLPADELARAYFDRGVTLDELGRTDDAIADYSAALKRAGNFAPALNNRANAERRLNRLPEAKADYRAALAAGDKERQYPYYGLGQVAEAEGDTKSAAEDYRMALAADGDYTLAEQRLAALGAQLGKIDLRPPVNPPVITARYEPPPELRPSIIGRPKEKRVAALAPPVLTATPEPGGALVQLGAFRDEASASSGWTALVSKSGGVLDGLSPRIVAADVPGKGKFYRLRTAVAVASAFCARLTAKGLACIPVR